MGRKVKVLDRGPYYLDGDHHVPFRDGYEGLGLLDGNGGALPAGAPPVFIDVGEKDLELGLATNSAGAVVNGREMNG